MVNLWSRLREGRVLIASKMLFARRGMDSSSWRGNDRRMNLVELAQRLKKIRKDRGLTLEEVASQAGLTRGWLSKVENFRVTPSVTALAGISSALGVSLSELFEGLDAKPAIVVTPRDRRVPLKRDEDVSELDYESLAAGRPARQMDPFVLRVPPSDHRPAFSHAGEEFLYVLAGRVRLEYADRAFEMGEGDSAYFDGQNPHRLVCLSETPAEVLVVYHGATTDEPGPADHMNGAHAAD